MKTFCRSLSIYYNWHLLPASNLWLSVTLYNVFIGTFWDKRVYVYVKINECKSFHFLASIVDFEQVNTGWDI